MTTDDRTELIAALALSYDRQNALLVLLEVLTTSFGGQKPLQPEMIETVQRHCATWRSELDELRKQLASRQHD
jgi:hypothetical protein